MAQSASCAESATIASRECERHRYSALPLEVAAGGNRRVSTPLTRRPPARPTGLASRDVISLGRGGLWRAEIFRDLEVVWN